MNGALDRISDGVDSFWVTLERLGNQDKSDSRSGRSSRTLAVLFTFGSDGVNCWHSLPNGGLRKQKRPLRATVTGDDVFPIGADGRSGKIIGVTQSMSFVRIPEVSTISHIVDPVPELPFFRVLAKTNPFVQTVLYDALAYPGDHSDVASAITEHFSRDRDYLMYILELLLYDAFEAANESDAPDSDKEAFSQVVKFLTRKDFPCVVVRCARKMDSSTWAPFFEVAGDPVKLFEECLEDDSMLSYAACFLKLLGETKDEATSLQCAERLLPRLLYASLYDLVAELLLFIHPQLSLPGAESSLIPLPTSCTVVLAHMEGIAAASTTSDDAFVVSSCTARLKACREALTEHGIPLSLFGPGAVSISSIINTPKEETKDDDLTKEAATETTTSSSSS